MATTSSSTSDAFQRYHPLVQRWVHRQGWTELHPIQEQAADPILSGDQDVIIGAATAGGKTEAAFLPIATTLADDWADEDLEGISALYVSPLKALINDQYERLSSLFDPLHVPVYRWHGDVPSHKKQKAKEQGGVLLITPESLEARFILQGWELGDWFDPLRYVVVDELHAFIGTERGRQLQSLLHRTELAIRRQVPRIALSATLGDFGEAARFLRPGGGDDARIIASDRERQTVKLQIRGYEHRPPELEEETGSPSDQDAPIEKVVAGDRVDIAHDLYDKLKGGRHIVFANRRREVELYADLLRRLCEKEGRANEFFPHHGSLSRDLRESAEARLRAERQPTTIIATTTLELGIDVGTVESIAQIGPPPSVASMRQRLGRSGRRGNPAVFRMYVREPELEPDSAPQDQLRTRLVRAAAMVKLLADRWYEPPVAGALHLSTLVQQTLSLIAQFGELDAKQGYEMLCKHGPFRAVSPSQFANLLRDLGRHELIQQEHNDALVLDLKGERLTDHYEFYAAFTTADEYKLIADGDTIGSLPISSPLARGVALIFGGRRWKVVDVDEDRKVIHLTAAKGGRPPQFAGAGGIEVHQKVRRTMLDLYENGRPLPYLSPGAQQLYEQGRSAYRELALREGKLLGWGDDTLWFPWVGDRALNAVLLELHGRGLAAGQEGPALTVQDTPVERVRVTLERVREEGFAPPQQAAEKLQNLVHEKHHHFLGEQLLAADYGSRHLDVESAERAVVRTVNQP